MAPPGVNATASARRRSTAIRRAARFRSVKYAILMYAAPSHTRGMTESELDVIARKHAKLRDELTAFGEPRAVRGSSCLTTTVLRQGPDEPLAREGPLSGRGDDEEHLTAYYEVNCETLDRAREIGTYVLDHHVTSVEIRRIHDTAEQRG
jgi:hypothetical protein